MAESGTLSEKLLSAVEPWVILAASTLITASYNRNFAIIDLARAPIRCSGQVTGTDAVIDVPAWFPAEEAVLELGDGTLYAKLKDVAVPKHKKALGEGVRWRLDLRGVAPMPQAPVSLTYFPWFRFLAEPVQFDALDRAAEYAAACIDFLLRRDHGGAMRALEGEFWRVTGAAGIVIEVHGIKVIDRIVITKESQYTSIDLKLRRIEIDRRMFPSACAAGDAMLKTADRPRHMDVSATGTHLILVAKEA